MSIAKSVYQEVKEFPKGVVFTYEEFMAKRSQKEAIIKVLNRMVQSGSIAKLGRGRFYRPKESFYGHLFPEEGELVKDLLQKKGKRTGYLTGYSIYNQLGLTTQMSNTIQIGKNQIRSTFQREGYVISFIRQKNDITPQNIPLLQVLDAIRYIKKIPDTSIEEACKRLLAIIAGLSVKDKATIVQLALKYPPSARALLGALLEETKATGLTDELYQSLNPITKYKLSGASKILSATEKWNII